jgi:crotonobetainyl-CoA:carnitine CoA-transferase CaiB-like acyl-CoA transferase
MTSADHLQGEAFDPPLGPMGYARLTSPYRKPFKTLDGYISILPYNTTHWQRFLELIGQPCARSDPPLRVSGLDYVSDAPAPRLRLLVFHALGTRELERRGPARGCSCS